MDNIQQLQKSDIKGLKIPYASPSPNLPIVHQRTEQQGKSSDSLNGLTSSKVVTLTDIVKSLKLEQDGPTTPKVSTPIGPQREPFVTHVNPETGDTYLEAPPPANEQVRVSSLKRLQLISPDEVQDKNDIVFNNLTRLATKLFNLPMSCITLVEEDRQVFKAHVGLPVDATPRSQSFCSHAILEPTAMFEVQDASKDDRFKGNPLVTGSPNIQYYASMPLSVRDDSSPEGEALALGAFCVMDSKPNKLTDEQLEILEMLALQAQAELQLLFIVNKLEIQNAVSNKLLSNILPEQIIQRLIANVQLGEAGESVIADSFASASVLFVDIVQFTAYASTVTAEQLVVTLGTLWTQFDRLATAFGITRIKTIGDGYLCVAGVPVASIDHAKDTVAYALALITTLQKFNVDFGTNFQVRCGIHSGNLVAGIIGSEKFSYDILGDTVNVASRIQSTGTPLNVHVSEVTFNLIKDDFDCRKLEPIECKGKGKIQTYMVLGRAVCQA